MTNANAVNYKLNFCTLMVFRSVTASLILSLAQLHLSPSRHYLYRGYFLQQPV